MIANYSTEKTYDVAFASGVSIYLDDFALRRCMANMKKYLKSSGIFITVMYLASTSSLIWSRSTVKIYKRFIQRNTVLVLSTTVFLSMNLE